MSTGKGFEGHLENFNAAEFRGFDHLNIDEMADLKAVILGKLMDKSEATQETYK